MLASGCHDTKIDSDTTAKYSKMVDVIPIIGIAMLKLSESSGAKAIIKVSTATTDKSTMGFRSIGLILRIENQVCWEAANRRNPYPIASFRNCGKYIIAGAAPNQDEPYGLIINEMRHIPTTVARIRCFQDLTKRIKNGNKK